MARVAGAALPRVLALAVERAVPGGLAHLACVGRVPRVPRLVLVPVLRLAQHALPGRHGLGQGVLGDVRLRALNEFRVEQGGPLLGEAAEARAAARYGASQRAAREVLPVLGTVLVAVLVAILAALRPLRTVLLRRELLLLQRGGWNFEQDVSGQHVHADVHLDHGVVGPVAGVVVVPLEQAGPRRQPRARELSQVEVDEAQLLEGAPPFLLPPDGHSQLAGVQHAGGRAGAHLAEELELGVPPHLVLLHLLPA